MAVEFFERIDAWGMAKLCMRGPGGSVDHFYDGDATERDIAAHRQQYETWLRVKDRAKSALPGKAR